MDSSPLSPFRCRYFALRAYSGMDPPDPIPNSEVKHASADDSWGATPCKSRSARGPYLEVRSSATAGGRFSCFAPFRPFNSLSSVPTLPQRCRAWTQLCVPSMGLVWGSRRAFKPCGFQQCSWRRSSHHKTAWLPTAAKLLSSPQVYKQIGSINKRGPDATPDLRHCFEYGFLRPRAAPRLLGRWVQVACNAEVVGAGGGVLRVDRVPGGDDEVVEATRL